MEKNPKPQIVLTPSQRQALDRLKAFVNSDDARVFILTGYAGTGKTTLMKALISWMSKEDKDFELLASTGRATKILSNKTNCTASTVHSCIYKFKDFNQDIEHVVYQIDRSGGVDKTGQLLLQFIASSADNEDYESKIYIVDESSMVSDFAERNPTQAVFGLGKLLTDLIAYDSKGHYIFVRDACQLSPIAQSFSPCPVEDLSGRNPPSRHDACQRAAPHL